jgi:hypothetical protein
MKRLITVVSLCTALAIGTTSCAHGQLTKQHAKDAALGAAVVAGIVLVTVAVPCEHCNVTPQTSAALPPK